MESHHSRLRRIKASLSTLSCIHSDVGLDSFPMSPLHSSLKTTGTLQFNHGITSSLTCSLKLGAEVRRREAIERHCQDTPWTLRWDGP